MLDSLFNKVAAFRPINSTIKPFQIQIVLLKRVLLKPGFLTFTGGIKM